MTDNRFTRLSFDEVMDWAQANGRLGRPTKTGILIRCPSSKHYRGDQNPSLNVGRNADGYAVIVCNSCDINELELKQHVRGEVYDEQGERSIHYSKQDLEDLIGKPSGAASATPDPMRLPDSFFEQTIQFQFLAEWADARFLSREAMLGAVLTYVSTFTPFQVLTPDVGRGYGSLNFYTVILGPSGTAKSEVIKNASDFLGVQFTRKIRQSKIASAEAMVRNFGMLGEEIEEPLIVGDIEVPPPPPSKVWKQTIDARMFTMDEGGEVQRMKDRGGNSVMEVMRTGWTGGVLQNDYVDVSKRAFLDYYAYRLTVLMGMQLEIAGSLFTVDELYGGTPQRILWVPSTLTHYREQLSPEPINWEPQAHGLYRQVTIRGRLMNVFDLDADVFHHFRELQETLLKQTIQNAKIIDPNLNGHSLFMRLKLACLIAAYHSRRDVQPFDWNAAGDIMNISHATREQIMNYQVQRTEEMILREEKLRLKKKLLRESLNGGNDEQLTFEVARKALEMIIASSTGYVTSSAVAERMKAGSEKRKRCKELLDKAVERGYLNNTNGRYTPGSVPVP